jgi:hypothetical protein
MGMSFAGGGNERIKNENDRHGNENGGRTGIVAEHGNDRLLLRP